jgi:hypothetical protein
VVDEWEEQVRRTGHANLASLMRSLKAIGATDHRATRRLGLTAPGLFREAAARYPVDPVDRDAILATWNIVILTLRKPE